MRNFFRATIISSFITVAVFPTLLFAQYDGCYSQTTAYCYTGHITCDLYSSSNNYYLYGETVGYLCDLITACLVDDVNVTNALNSCKATLTECNNTVAARTNESAACASAYSGCETNRKEWIAYAANIETSLKKQKALERKLRKACGTKCKRIKGV